jgi:hypothetical protein
MNSGQALVYLNPMKPSFGHIIKKSCERVSKFLQTWWHGFSIF